MPALTNVYLDYAATTPVDERVLAAMLPYFSEHFGNASSVHRFGQAAEAALEEARLQIARALGARPSEIIFTSGGTESDNLAVRGAAWAERRRRGANHILTTPVEHPAVLNACRHLAEFDGFELELLPVDATGRVDPDSLRRGLRSQTALVSIIWANNEIGTINPIGELAAICRQAGIPLHSDAVQGAAHLPVAVDDLGIDLLSIGAHKLYGPKGVGALYCRTGIELAPIQRGGSQESARRAGTENVAAIVGLAHALELAVRERPTDAPRLRAMRDRVILAGTAIPASRLTGHPTERLPNHASFAFEGIEGNRLLAGLDLAGFACSSGSACKTGDPEPSSVLLAIGLTPGEALGSLRVTLGRPTSDHDLERFLTALPKVVSSLRQRSPVAA